jgi:thioesterase domain-containing protein
LLVSEIEKTFNKHFSLASFFQFPTIAEIAQSISEPLVDLPKIEFITKLDSKDYQKLLTGVIGRPGLRPSQTSLMVCLNSNAKKKPFFFCANGIDEVYSLSKYLKKKQSFYFLESGFTLFLKERQVTEKNIKNLASHHVNDILTIQPESEYLLVGYSFGSLIVYEIAKQLEEKGKKVAFLGILDMYGNDPILKYFLAVNIFYIRVKTLMKLIITRNFAEIHLKNRRIFNSLILRLRMKLKSLTKLIINKNLSPTNHNFDSVTESMYVPNNNLDQYKMDGYQGKITLFLAEERINSNPVEKLISLLFYGYGWTRESLFEVHKISGSHETMIQEPHVKLLAEKLASHLGKSLPD